LQIAGLHGIASFGSLLVLDYIEWLYCVAFKWLTFLLLECRWGGLWWSGQLCACCLGVHMLQNRLPLLGFQYVHTPARASLRHVFLTLVVPCPHRQFTPSPFSVARRTAIDHRGLASAHAWLDASFIDLRCTLHVLTFVF
jgi:hypothetical protein